MILKVPSNPRCSMFLWFYESDCLLAFPFVYLYMWIRSPLSLLQAEQSQPSVVVIRSLYPQDFREAPVTHLLTVADTTQSPDLFSRFLSLVSQRISQSTSTADEEPLCLSERQHTPHIPYLQSCILLHELAVGRGSAMLGGVSAVLEMVIVPCDVPPPLQSLCAVSSKELLDPFSVPFYTSCSLCYLCF